MDVLGGVRKMNGHKKHSRRSKLSKKDDIKVVYISSPMKVKTCASQFRALVQELTGKDSDVAVRFMDNDGSSADNSPASSEATRVVDDDRVGGLLPMPNNSSHGQSVFESFEDDGLMSEGSFLGMFTSNLFHDPSQFDAAFRSFDSI